MGKTTAKVAKWLADCGMEDIKPVRVTVGMKNPQTWVGCEYRNPMINRELTIYLVGPRFQRRGRFCFNVNGQVWYTAAYIDEIESEWREFHPFGVNWMIAPWTAPLPIDYGETSIRRIELKIEYLDWPLDIATNLF